MTMEHADKKVLRCSVCLETFSNKELNQDTKSCPRCGTTNPPLSIAHDGYFYLNWQDIRVLAIYAQRWAMTFDMTNKGNADAVEALENIIESLEKYQPEGSLGLDPTIKESKSDTSKAVLSPYYFKL